MGEPRKRTRSLAASLDPAIGNRRRCGFSYPFLRQSSNIGNCCPFGISESCACRVFAPLRVPTTPSNSVLLKAERGKKTRWRPGPARGGVIQYPRSGQSSKLWDRIPSSRSPSRRKNRTHKPANFGRRSKRLLSVNKFAFVPAAAIQSAFTSAYGAL